MAIGFEGRNHRGLPLLGLIATFLISARPMASQGAPVSNWQSSPVLTKFLEEMRAPGKITVALPDGNRTYPGSPTVADHYTIDINQFTDKLHPALPPTTLWGYHPTVTLGGFPQAHLGGIIIAQRGKPVQVTFRNNLPPKHILPVDGSIQGADPSVTENRTAVHLHGGAVPWFSDGGPFGFWDANGNKGINFINNVVLNPGAAGNEAEYYYPNEASARLMWYHDHAMGITRLNAYAGIASAYIIRDKFEAALVRDFGLPGFVENGGRELPLVFQDKIFQNGKSVDPALPFPGAAKGEGNLWYPYEYDLNRWDRDPLAPNPLPPTSVVAEAFGDTMLVNGSAFPKATVDPRRYRFRVLNACQARVLNLQLYEDNGHGQPNFKKPGPHWTVIGTEGGFLARPVTVPSAPLKTFLDPLAGRWLDPAAPGGSLIVATGERFDLVVDFNGKGGKKYILCNDAPAPYPNGSLYNDYPNAAGIGDTSVLMRFEVKADGKAIPKDAPWLLTPFTPMAGIPDARIDPPLAGRLAAMPTPLLSWLTATTTPLPIPTRKGVIVRHLTLNESFDASGRLIQMLGTNVAPKTGDFSRPYYDPADEPLSAATETPAAGATEVWEIANLTGDTHPIHFHLVNAQVLSRRAFDTVAYANTPPGIPAVPTYYPNMPARGPEAIELGWKETVKMHPGEVTTVIMKFDLAKVPFTVPPSPRTGGNEYVWHCHILEHEEHDMMRTLVVK
jgi:spore coat protein A